MHRFRSQRSDSNPQALQAFRYDCLSNPLLDKSNHLVGQCLCSPLSSVGFPREEVFEAASEVSPRIPDHLSGNLVSEVAPVLDYASGSLGVAGFPYQSVSRCDRPPALAPQAFSQDCLPDPLSGKSFPLAGIPANSPFSPCSFPQEERTEATPEVSSRRPSRDSSQYDSSPVSQSESLLIEESE
jgi:hypothetical protein